ncbi:MAG: putative sugar O-methyltransferase [Bacteroidetes bacterium]|nr:putative sugar O-methyltransferase [Bacteroidota bacterium]
MVDGYKHILEYLYDKYYISCSERSDVTSSYWRTIGVQKVWKKKNCYKVEGYAFGGYRTKNMINYLKYIPMRILLSYFIREYRLPKYLLQAQKTILERFGFLPSIDSYKQILSYNTILKTLDNIDKSIGKKISSICIIGDGYGFFSSLIKLTSPNIKVISVNLGRTLFFDVFYSEKCLPDIHPLLLKINSENIQLSTSKLVFIEAENYSLLENLEVDLFINIASMQEMNPDVIDKYFKYMRSSKKSARYFYCCNRLEKVLPDGTITKFINYPWRDCDDVLIDELCPWYQKYISTRPPFFRLYDSPIQHRFVKLSDL